MQTRPDDGTGWRGDPSCLGCGKLLQYDAIRDARGDAWCTACARVEIRMRASRDLLAGPGVCRACLSDERERSSLGQQLALCSAGYCLPCHEARLCGEEHQTAAREAALDDRRKQRAEEPRTGEHHERRTQRAAKGGGQ